MVYERPFRLTFEEALSYFIGGLYEEDKGYALPNIKGIKFEIAGEQCCDDTVLSYGWYDFYLANFREIKERMFTFVYQKFENGGLKIIAHHSSFPAILR
ncbi:MAG: hypothetical protein N2327_05935 [Caldimicrobium sp.]|nr:hypothetical protein [Caldimicrobium sp.]MCX7873951.1 hypothetical protein [Caldimicrobium sp.]MDW8094210.1 hypothetical protein [Caldimicrobium sp.]